MSIPLVIITHDLPVDWIKSLKGRVRIQAGPADATSLSPELKKHLHQAEGLLCLLTIPVNETLLTQMPRLRVVSNMATGVDNIDIDACTRRGIPVGNTPGVLTDATADLTMLLLLASARRLNTAAMDARNGRWKTWLPAGWLGKDLHGSTLGIVGMGKIGHAVAERARSFGLKVIYTDVTKPETDPGFEYVSLDSLLKGSDFISLHCPLTAGTHGLIDQCAFKRMKPDAILINAARGQIVDTGALVRALQEGWIGGAALDVTDPEPLPKQHPLFALSNCLIVPHIGSATHGTRRKMAEMACENILAGLAGNRLPYCVNPEIYGS